MTIAFCLSGWVVAALCAWGWRRAAVVRDEERAYAEHLLRCLVRRERRSTPRRSALEQIDEIAREAWR